MPRERKTRPKPQPYRWLCNGSGVVEFYDFQFWKVSDPPGIDDDPVIVDFLLWIKRERPDFSVALSPYFASRLAD